MSLVRARTRASPQELKLCGAVPIGVVESAMSGMPSAEVFQVIVDRIDSGVYALDLEGKITYWNYGAEKISGFLSQEVLGRACRVAGDACLPGMPGGMLGGHCAWRGPAAGSGPQGETNRKLSYKVGLAAISR